MRIIIKHDRGKGKVDEKKDWTKVFLDSTETSTTLTSVPTISASDVNKKCDTSISSAVYPDSTIKSLLLNKYIFPPKGSEEDQKKCQLTASPEPQYPLPPFKTLKKHLAGSTFRQITLPDGSPHYEIDRTVYHEQELLIIEEITKTLERQPMSFSSNFGNRKRSRPKENASTNSFLFRSNFYGNPSIIDYRQQQQTESSLHLPFTRNYNRSNSWSFFSSPPPGQITSPFGYGYKNSSTSSRGVQGTVQQQNFGPLGGQQRYLQTNPFSSSVRSRFQTNEHATFNSNYKWQRCPIPNYAEFGSLCCPCGCCCPMDAECWTPNSPSPSIRSMMDHVPAPVCYPCPCGCTQDVDVTIQQSPMTCPPPYMIQQQQSMPSTITHASNIGLNAGGVSVEEPEHAIQIVYENTVPPPPYNHQRSTNYGFPPWFDGDKTVSNSRSVMNWSKNNSLSSFPPPPYQDIK